MIDRELFGKKVSALRKKLGYSQSELAEKLNISTQAVSKWECGLALPDIDALLELSWLFEITINNLIEEEKGIVIQETPKSSYISDLVDQFAKNDGQRSLINAISTYYKEDEMIKIGKDLCNDSLKIHLTINVEDEEKDYRTKVSIPITNLSKMCLRELAPAITEAIGNSPMGNIDRGLRRIGDLFTCPDCKSKLHFDTKDGKVALRCKKNHIYPVDEGVLYFNTREIQGEEWSLTYRNYNYYLLEVTSPLAVEYNRGDIYDEELKWREIKKRKPRIILDVASGTGLGIKYALERIDWNCTVILTDLSHRILAWNRKYITENLFNPYVDMVYIACDCSNMPFQDKSIDCITSNGGFESMQNKTIAGFQDAYRILRDNGYAIYDMSLVNNLESENTKKWIQLFGTIEGNNDAEGIKKMRDLGMWKDICKNIGYQDTYGIEVYNELPAPDVDIFPFENQILRWMCCYVFVSKK